MNYWAAQSSNLRETVEPLISFVKDLARSGQATAKLYYNVSGASSPGGAEKVGAAVVALLDHRHLRPGDDHRLAEVLEHKR